MAVNPQDPYQEPLYGIRQFILELSRRHPERNFITKAIGISIAVHLICVVFYLLFYLSFTTHIENLKIKIGEADKPSTNVPHKPSSVEVGLVKSPPKKPEPAPPTPAPEAPKPVAKAAPPAQKPLPPLPLPLPLPRLDPQRLPQPAPPRTILPELPDPLPKPEAAPQPAPSLAVDTAPQADSGQPAAGYEHGTDNLAEQEQPLDYEDILYSWLKKEGKGWEEYQKLVQGGSYEGVVRARFFVKDNGFITHFRVLNSSGHVEIDNLLRIIVARANPAPPIPADETRREFDLIWCFYLRNSQYIPTICGGSAPLNPAQ